MAGQAHVVWTGDELVVWGGVAAGGTVAAHGVAVDVASGVWRDVPPAPTGPLRPSESVAVWSGHELLVWGPVHGDPGVKDHGPGPVRGAAWDPSSGQWRTLSRAPVARADLVAGVWTDRGLVVWGRTWQGSAPRDDERFAARYDPDGAGWSRLDAPPLEMPVTAAVWDGRSTVYLWGSAEAGVVSSDTPPTGAALDLRSGRWRLLPPVNAELPSARTTYGVTAAWTGKAAYLVGGPAPLRPFVLLPGDPVTWAALRGRDGDAGPVARVHPLVAWTGEELLVWGGARFRGGPGVDLHSWRSGPPSG